MDTEVRNLKELPLEQLISAPLNAVIAAQANAAMTTALFVEKVGFKNKGDQRKSIFDRLNPGATANPDKFDVRVAEVAFVKKEKDTSATPPTVREVEERVQIPFVSLFNIPSIDINEMTWDFSVRLKKVEEFETDFSYSNSTTTSASGSGDIGLASLGIPVSIGARLSVESTTKSDFDIRYGLGRDHEYNLKIQVRASQGRTPPGIERLLAIAERIAASNEAAAAP